ncbi:MAG: hypothetical protein ABIS35_15190, partial [Terracoccus sp.]
SGPPDDDALIEQAISLVTSLLERGWAVAGDIVAGQHVPWTVSSDAAHHRIAALWRHDHDSAVGYDVWLDPTEPGIARGEALVKREEGLVEWVSPARAALQRRGDRGASETPRPPEDPRAGSLDNAPAD